MIRAAFLFRAAPVASVFAFSLLLAVPTGTASRDAVQNETGVLLEYEGHPIRGSKNEIQQFEYDNPLKTDRCWKLIADIDNPDAAIQAMLPVPDGLLIGTQKGELWVFDGEHIVQEKGSLSIRTIYALAKNDQEQILVGTFGGTGIAEKESGLWIWTRPTNTWDVDPNANFPAYADVTAILVDTYPGQDTVYAGTRSYGIFRREEGWWRKTGGMDLGMGVFATRLSDIRQIAVSRTGNHILYAVAATAAPDREPYQGFFRMDNPGQGDAVWQAPQTDMEPYGYNVWSVAPDPDYEKGVWIGTERGLFYSSDAGNDWKRIKIDPEPAKIQAILPFKNFLIAQTSDGIMTAPLSESRGGNAASAPHWSQYKKTGKGLCPIGELPTPTVNPVPSTTAAPTATATHAAVESRVLSITPTPFVLPPPDGDGRSFVLGALTVLVFLAGIMGIWVYIQRSRRIRILYLGAEPVDEARLRSGREFEEIRSQLEHSRYHERFRLEPRMAVTKPMLSQALLDLEPQMIHFSGHGMESGEICLENSSGYSTPVTPKDLSALFQECSDRINCVVLSACYSEKQAAALAKHIDIVIGMKKELGDDAAIAFAVGFYQGLGRGHRIEKAFRLGCAQAGMQDNPEAFKPIIIKKIKKRSFAKDILDWFRNPL